MKRIVLAGGCFWGVEAYYKQLKGVLDTNVGYTNGNIDKPKYKDLKEHRATHAEAVEIFYDENVITLTQLLDHMFRFIDPLSFNKQGEDEGIQYRTGVYYQTEEDRITIENFMLRKKLKFGGFIAVEVKPETGFWLAEEYHQDYLDKKPNGYCHVNFGVIKPAEKK
jgi:methionine-S-sulfoxide reductase